MKKTIVRPGIRDGALGVAAGWGILVAALTALVGAVLGGLWGMRFHRRVDRAVSETIGALKCTP